jgi:hypothetical protein
MRGMTTMEDTRSEARLNTSRAMARQFWGRGGAGGGGRGGGRAERGQGGGPRQAAAESQPWRLGAGVPIEARPCFPPFFLTCM